LKKKIFLFGASGTLGTNLIYFLKKDYDIIFNVHKKKYFFNNISYCNYFKNEKSISEKNLFEKLSLLKPDILINCAANTDLDYCEKYKNTTKFVNQNLPGLLSNVCKKLSIKFIHVSTDHLYGKLCSFKKKENFPTNPINVYGLQKRISEKKVFKNNKNSIIIRTNFFGYSPDKKQFLDTIISNGKNLEKSILYTDYFFTPISTKYLSKFIHLLIKLDFKGVINVVSDETISKYDFANKVYRLLNLDTSLLIKSKIKNIHRAKRCKDLSLSNMKLKKIINSKIPSLDFQLANFFKEKKLIEQKFFSKIPYGKHSINKNDIKSVSVVLKSGSLTQGKFISETENKIANYVGSKYAVLTSSATAGLHITYKALGLNQNNTLITSPITFVSTANAGIYCNSNISFCDIDSDTISISLKALEKKIDFRKTKILSPVHMGGLAANMKEIHKLTYKSNIEIVEDASHALGSKYECGAKVGSCKYSKASVFSFHPVKIIASGEGGVVTTNDKNLYEKILSLRSHGIISKGNMINSKIAYTNKKKNIWYYEMQSLGFHYRQTEIHAALLNSQLDRIDSFISKRQRISNEYDKFFKNNKVIRPLQKKYRNLSSNHLYVVNIDFKKININRNQFMKQLRMKNIITQVHYIPLPFHPFYKNLGYTMKGLDSSKEYYENCLSLPIYYELTKEKQKYVIDSIQELIS